MSRPKIVTTRELVGELPEFKLSVRDHPEWETSQAALRPDERAQEMSDYAYSVIPRSDLIGYLEAMAKPIYKPLVPGGPREWTPKPIITDDDLELMADTLKAHQAGLEITELKIRTAIEYAWQAAIWASSTDVRSALLDAVEHDVEDMMETIGAIWDPIKPQWTDEDLTEDLLSEMSSVQDKDGILWLTFSPGIAASVMALLKKTPAKELARTKRGLKEELEYFFSRFVTIFFRTLKKDMKEVDALNRLDIRKQWKDYVKSEKFEDVRREMLAFVRQKRQEESGVELGRCGPQLGIAARSIYTECRLVNVESNNPHRLSSVNLIYDQATRRIMTISIEVESGRLRALSLDSCGRSPGMLAGEIELMRYFLAHTPGKYTLTIMEDLAADQAIDAMVSEVLMFNLADPDEIRAALARQFESCFPVVRR